MKYFAGSVLSVVLVSALAMLPATVQAASIVKIGIVDLQKALNATTEGMAAKKSLKTRHSAKQDKLDSMQEELKAMEDKLKSPVLSKEALSDLQEKYRAKKQEIIEFLTVSKQEEEKENQALSGRILKGLVEIARKIGQDEGYTVMLEKNSGGIIYAIDSLDLTERVVKIYNEDHQGSGGSGN